MKKKNENGKINLPKNDRKWKLYNNIANFCNALDQLPDAAKAKEEQLRSAPLPLLPMVF